MGRQGGQGAPRAARIGLAALALAALALPGCRDATGTSAGGDAPGNTLSIYSMLPQSGPRAATAQAIVDGEKLALAQAGGVAGPFKVNISSLDQPGSARKVADSARDVIHDLQVGAAITDLDSATARVTIPLFNEAGVLQLSPGATYSGFVAPVPGAVDPAAPGVWAPSGRQSFAPLLPTDAAQAVAIAHLAGGRVAVEAEPSQSAQALAAAVRAQLAKTVPTERADTFVYAGEDPVNARGVVESVLRERPHARVILPDALVRAGLAQSLPDAVARRVTFVTAAGPAEQDRAFADAFRRSFRRDPAPYALVGYRAMRSILAVVARLGQRAHNRQAIIDAYFAANPPARLATQPFWALQRRGARTRYEPLSS